jgi:hypothetical protein
MFTGQGNNAAQSSGNEFLPLMELILSDVFGIEARGEQEVLDAIANVFEPMMATTIPPEAQILANFLPTLKISLGVSLAATKVAKTTFWVPFVGKVSVGSAVVALGVTSALVYTYSVAADVMLDWAQARIDDQANIVHQPGLYSVYVLRNNDIGAFYVGHTRQTPSARFAQHNRRPELQDFRPFQMYLLATGRTQPIAHLLENGMILAYTKDALMNKIYAMSQLRWDKVTQQYGRIETLLKTFP